MSTWPPDERIRSASSGKYRSDERRSSEFRRFFLVRCAGDCPRLAIIDGLQLEPKG